MRLSLRIGAILSLMAVVITIPLYVELETNNFNAYCADERADVIRSGLADPETWMTAIMWLVITALPCLAARQSRSLKIFAILAAGFRCCQRTRTPSGCRARRRELRSPAELLAARIATRLQKMAMKLRRRCERSEAIQKPRKQARVLSMRIGLTGPALAGPMTGSGRC
jgi:hypothetical protein